MARFSKDRNFEPVISAAKEWIHSCLIADNSLFSKQSLWNPETIAQVRSAFVDHPDEGEDKFFTKLKRQMADASASAQRLMAEMLWVLTLFPSNIKASTKRSQVSEIWAMSGEALDEGHLLLSEITLAGVGSGGPGFNNHRWRELVFLITLVGDLKKRSAHERQELLSEYQEFVNWIAQVPQEGHRQLRHMLRFFCFPDQVERMSSNRERWAVLAGFQVATEKELRDWSDQQLDEGLRNLRNQLEKEYPGKKLDFYDPPLQERWKPLDERETATGQPCRFWVEKTHVKDRPDRLAGPHALGRALWSPQRADGNRDIYRQMRDVREGDVVFHFVDDAGIQGVSIAAGQADERFEGVDGTQWAGRASYRIPLREFRELTPPVTRSDFLEDANYRSRLSSILERNRGLFFNRKFNLNQGSYLTEAPLELVRLWDEIYRQKVGHTLLPGIDLVGADPVRDLVDVVICQPLDETCVQALVQSMREAGVVVSPTLVIRLLSSLISKNFLLLTGLSGSGKTKIARAIAGWLPPSSNCFRVVAVGADWTGNDNVLGYPNGLEKCSYISKPSLSLILHAQANPRIPHFLILDEMNLSHVERYFADILSAIESDEKIHLHQDAERKASSQTIPADINLPKNLFIIGTVNVDETTYMFSPKVLDRANVIEFRMAGDELVNFLCNPVKPDLSKADGKGAAFGAAFVDSARNAVAVPADVKEAYDSEMLLFFRILQTEGVEFGYRTAYEAGRFMHFYKRLCNYSDDDTTWFRYAFDCVVFQKLLPKLHGSRAKLGPILKKLWFLCVIDSVGRTADPLKAVEEAVRSTDKKVQPTTVVPSGAPYPLSAEKIGRMWRLLSENGFASFSEA